MTMILWNQQLQQDDRRLDFHFNTLAFPAKLHSLLSDAEREGFQDIINWQPDGKSFKIHKPEVFEQTIMQSYFMQTKFKSFQRQLNIYGFKMVQVGHNKGGYAHKNFLKDQLALCDRIVRRKDVRASSSSSQPSSTSRSAANNKKYYYNTTGILAPRRHMMSSCCGGGSSTMTASLEDVMVAPLIMDADDQGDHQAAVHHRRASSVLVDVFALKNMAVFFDLEDSSSSIVMPPQQQQAEEDDDAAAAAAAASFFLEDHDHQAFFLKSFNLGAEDGAVLDDLVALLVDEDESTIATTTTSSTTSSTSDDDELLFQSLVLPDATIASTTTSTTTTTTTLEQQQDEANADDEDLSFPFKLHLMLESAEQDNYSHIVSWINGGTAFKVYDTDAFVNHVMPHFFNQSKYESFRRQLNLYHFTRKSKGLERGVISHPCLRQGQRQLCRLIQR